MSDPRKRLESVFVDIGTRLDKIAGPFLARAGIATATVDCPWCQAKQAMYLSFLPAGVDGLCEATCSGCGTNGILLFHADDGEGTNAYVIIRRDASVWEVHEIASIGR
jgi:hypothetical protein